MFTGILILIIFVIMAALMYLKKLPALLALPIMAVVIAVAGRAPVDDILRIVVAEGSIRLHKAIITVLFGAMLGQFIKESGIAETIVKKAAEFAGDRPFSVGLALAITSALLFTVLGGLGAVIMVGTIVLPIMLSIGMPSIVAGCLFLLGLSLGGILNLTNWQLYITILRLKQTDILKFALPLFFIFIGMTIAFLLIELKRQGKISLWASTSDPLGEKDVPYYALLTPVIPLILVLSFSLYNLIAKPAHPFEFPIISALVIGLIYGILTTWKREADKVNLISKSIIEGTKNVMPAVVLMIGIGMVLNSVTHPMVSKAISPLISQVMPKNPFTYVLLFAIFAPLALYRGPLNIWGMGSGLIALMLVSRSIPAAAIMAAMLSVGQIQGVCDPTNTHNVWTANFLNINVQDILRRTIPYMWIVAVLGLIVGAVLYF